jgi:hypothetical protein
MTAPWLADRRYYRPDARHTAGLTYDDIPPTESDNEELKRSLGRWNRKTKTWSGVNGGYQRFHELGFNSEPCPVDADEFEAAAWQQGRFDRNWERQQAVWALVCRVARGLRKARR